MKLARSLAEVAEILRGEGARFAVVGGLAASARGEVRFTRDVDLAVSVVDDVEAETLVRAFVLRGYQLTATVEQEATQGLATARLCVRDSVVCDLVFATCGIEEEVINLAAQLELLPKLIVPTATTEALLAMKVLSATSQRPRDLGDIQAMIAVNPDFDGELVERLLRLIMQRGYARGQNLLEKWRTMRATLT